MSHFNRCPAFTLVELLTVITITSVLLALTLPSVRAARDTAMITRCLSNQRGISMSGVGIYASDYQGVIVPAVGRGRVGRINSYAAAGFSSTPLVTSQGWSISMWELLNPGNYNPDGAQSAYAMPNAYCPSDRPWWRGQLGDWREANYGLNAYLSYARPGGLLTHTRRDSLGRLSEKALFIETHHQGAHGVRSGLAQTAPSLTAMLVPMFPSEYWIAGDKNLNSMPRHMDGFTTSYVDGHAQYIKHPAVFEISSFPFDPAGVKSSVWFNYSLLAGGFYNPEFNVLWAPYPSPWVP